MLRKAVRVAYAGMNLRWANHLRNVSCASCRKQGHDGADQAFGGPALQGHCNARLVSVTRRKLPHRPGRQRQNDGHSQPDMAALGTDRDRPGIEERGAMQRVGDVVIDIEGVHFRA